MKPRQTLKNYHNSNVSPYQQQQQQNSSTSANPSAALRDIDLAKIGISLDDMPNLQALAAAINPNLSSQEEIVKCLQAIYGGKNSGDTSTKLLPSLNDWPMQSISPPDYSRIGGGNGTTAGSSASSNISGGNSLIMGTGGIGFNNSGNNSASSGQQQDIQQFSNNHHRHSHHHQTPSSSSAINHFRMSNMHSPQQQQQLSQQQKSVLSIHQHHQNDLSNRRLNHNMSTTSASSSFANLNAATAAAVNASSSNATTSIPSNSNSSSLDTNHISALAGNFSAGGKNSNSSHVSNIMDTLGSIDGIFYQDAASSSPSSSIQASNNNNNNASSISSLSTNNQQQQQSLIKHQQLQKLLKANNSQLKSPSLSATTLSHTRNDIQPQRNITSNNHNNMSQAAQLPISSSPATISPPQATAFTSVPKSLLNLAACSSSSPTSSASALPNAASKFSSMVSQLNLKSARNASLGTNGNQTNLNSSNGGNGINSCRSMNRAQHSSFGSNMNSNSYNDAFNQWNTNGMNDSNIITSHNTRPTTISNSAASTSTRSGLKQQLQLSLLSEDQSTPSSRTSNSLRAAQCNFNPGSTTSSKQTLASAQQQIHQKAAPLSASSKEAFLASLHERAARAGLSIGEINKPAQVTGTSSTNLNINNNLATTSTNTTISNSNIATPDNLISTQQQNISPNQSSTKDDFMNDLVDRKEIESALNRVGARNDLSLLYPPMLLASNSQKQINALSAGLQGAEDSELFTKEVKRIVLEECNIIYECKECNNLFRSLANLVKHKRTYCLEANSERSSMDMNRRHHMNTIPPIDQSATNINNSNTGNLLESDEVIDQHQAKVVDVSLRSRQTGGEESSLLATSTNYIYPSSRGGPAATERRPNLANDLRAIRALQRERRSQQARDIVVSKLRDNHHSHSDTPTTTQTSLSKLLQSQPKNRLPVTRDSALMGALNITTPVSLLNTNELQVTNDPLSAFESDKNMHCSSHEIMNEQLVRNSTLAKSLLDEKVRNISTNPRQSLIELSRAELIQTRPMTSTTTTKRMAPKRKFLEDCIQKVKRDKLLTEEEEDEEGSQVEMVSIASNSSTSNLVKGSSLLQADVADQVDLEGLDEASKRDSLSNDSDVDSDMLTIDLDGPEKKVLGKKVKRQLGNAASSSSSSTSSSVKLNSSSALLKALTRPVDPKRLCSNQAQVSNEEPPQEQLVQQHQEPSEEQEPKQLDKIRNEPDHLEAAKEEEEEAEQEEVESPLVSVEASLLELAEPSSPLFDKYTCDICDIDHKDLASLMKHTIDDHKEERMVYPCIFCSFSFMAMENVCRHIIDIHKKPRAQVHRLKEVVRSRSHMSSDFYACSDTGLMEALAKRIKKEQIPPTWSPSSSSSSPSSSGSSSSSSGSSSSSSSSTDSNQPKKLPENRALSSEESAASSPGAWQGEVSPPKQRGDNTSSSSGSDGDDDDDDSSSSSSNSSSSSSSSSEAEDTKGSKGALDSDSTKVISHATLKDQTTQQSQDRQDKKLSLSASNDSEEESEVYPESEYDSNPPSVELSDKTPEQQVTTKQPGSGSSSQQQQQRSSSFSNKSTSESAPSSSSSAAVSGSGGNIKLKIQLKTRPDEKSKVYEIV